MSSSEAPRTTYHTSRWQRGLALACAAGAVLFAGLAVTSGPPLFSWWTLLNLGTTGSMMVAMAAYGLHARIEVRAKGLRKVRPLWWDETIRFEAVERMLLPMSRPGLALFTGPGGQSQFDVDGSAFEDFDQLAREVCRRLPPDAEVEDPADRLDDFRDGRRS